MTRYGLRARVITLTLAPTLIIGLLLSAFFSFNRYHDLEKQVINSGLSIIEPLAIASEEGLKTTAANLSVELSVMRTGKTQSLFAVSPSSITTTIYSLLPTFIRTLSPSPFHAMNLFLCW